MKARGEGKGKAILLGEHFVVHGAPAVAAGIENKATVEVEPAAQNNIITKQYVVREMSLAGIQRVLDAMGIKEKFNVHLAGDLPTYGGLGSSAAFCVGMVKAFAAHKGINLTKEQINGYAFEGEKAFHGTPSGIDNFVATYGGVVIYKKGIAGFYQFIEPKVPLHLVIGYTGKISPTLKMIEAVKKFKESDEEKFSHLLDEATVIAYRGAAAVERGKIEDLGILMNENQALLSETGVSIEENDAMVKAMLAAGALGAKLTGGGGGGCCIALARDMGASLEIVRTLKKGGRECFSTVVTK